MKWIRHGGKAPSGLEIVESEGKLQPAGAICPLPAGWKDEHIDFAEVCFYNRRHGKASNVEYTVRINPHLAKINGREDLLKLNEKIDTFLGQKAESNTYVQHQEKNPVKEDEKQIISDRGFIKRLKDAYLRK